MTITVSISEFRQNISDYLDRVKAGDRLILKDEKKEEEIADVIPRKKFNQKKYAAEYRKMLKRVAGTFTAKNHPEWATKKDVIRWLRKTRKAAERKFDVPPGF